MAYQAAFKPSFFKDLSRLPQAMRQRCADIIERLTEDPSAVAAKKLGGHTQLYRCRIGDYRLVYFLNGRERKILFLLIAHRKDVYRYLSRMPVPQ